MKITLNKTDLHKALQTVTKIVNPKPVIPMYSNVLFELGKKGIQISGTNLEISLRYTIPDVEADDFQTAIPAKFFADLVANIQGEKITMEYKPEKKSLNVSTKNSKANLNCMDASDFKPIPTMDKKNKITLNSTLFKQIINRVSFASEPDAIGINPILNGVLITTEENKLVFFATDGFHLSYEEVSIKKPIKMYAIVRATVLETIAKVLPDNEQMDISISDNQIRISCGDIEISAQKTEGKYPDYKLFVAGKSNVTIGVTTIGLFGACKQLELFTQQGIRMKTQGMMIGLSANSQQLGATNIQLVANVSGEIEIGVNVVYLKQFLGIVHTDEVIISMEDDTKPILLTMKDFPSYYHIIMPFNLKNIE